MTDFYCFDDLVESNRIVGLKGNTKEIEGKTFLTSIEYERIKRYYGNYTSESRETFGKFIKNSKDRPVKQSAVIETLNISPLAKRITKQADSAAESAFYKGIVLGTNQTSKSCLKSVKIDGKETEDFVERLAEAYKEEGLREI